MYLCVYVLVVQTSWPAEPARVIRVISAQSDQPPSVGEARTHQDFRTLCMCVCVRQSVKPLGQRSPFVSSESTALSHSQCLPRTNRVNRACFRVCVCVRGSSLLASGACTSHPSHQRSVLHNDQPPPVGWTVSLLFLQPLDKHQREQEQGAKLSGFMSSRVSVSLRIRGTWAQLTRPRRTHDEDVRPVFAESSITGSAAVWLLHQDDCFSPLCQGSGSACASHSVSFSARSESLGPPGSAATVPFSPGQRTREHSLTSHSTTVHKAWARIQQSVGPDV